MFHSFEPNQNTTISTLPSGLCRLLVGILQFLQAPFTAGEPGLEKRTSRTDSATTVCSIMQTRAFCFHHALKWFMPVISLENSPPLFLHSALNIKSKLLQRFHLDILKQVDRQITVHCSPALCRDSLLKDVLITGNGIISDRRFAPVC
ncbi:hypothetical protein Pla110_08540 [Polystyrenella longa]|uniref:Uncharacterized protein n=1 Tax=Polystyrenella longa TaxID=2528007 RepID=A0A518CIU0_9PLAN|nr:hypothetical protein Pla110_08540 [Polystyrenella longa]